MTELVVGTKKGLFLLEGEPGSGFEITARAFAGQPVDFATRDPRSGRLLATVTSPFYGPKIFYTDGDPDAEWEQADGVALPEGGDQALERIWVIARGEADGTLYAGGDPGVLFESHDGGASWEINAGLWEQPSRSHWQPGGGGLCLHSICTWPGDPDKLAVAVSAAGMWLTEDGGRTWRRGNEGLNPRYLPEEALEGRERGPLRAPRRARARAARADVHAVPRRRLSLRRRRRELDRHRRRRAPVGLRLPADGRPRRSRQRLRDPARRRHGSRHPRRPRARLRDARRRLAAGPRGATACRPSTPT